MLVLVQNLQIVKVGDKFFFIFGLEGGIFLKEIVVFEEVGVIKVGLGLCIMCIEIVLFYVLSVISYLVELL